MKRHRAISFAWAAGIFLLLAFVARLSFSALGDVVGFAPSAGFAAAVVGIHWPERRQLAVMFGLIAAMVGAVFGIGFLPAAAFGLGVGLEAIVATGLLKRHGDPTKRPETAGWWAHWAHAAALGAAVGSIPFVLVTALTTGISFGPVLVSWLSGHVGGMLLVSPGVWAWDRWQRADGWRHGAEFRQLAEGFGVVAAATVSGGVSGFLLGRPEPFVLPVLALGWLAHTRGHRVTVMASSAVATTILLLVPWWAKLHPVSPVAATVLVVLGHAAASGLAIESSARWHARALLAGVVDIATEAVLIVDSEGRVMVGNPSSKGLFGDSLEGRSIGDLLPSLPADWTSVRLSGAMFEARGARGQFLSVEVTVGDVDAPGRPMKAVVCRDMTEIRDATAALRRAGEIIDATPDLVGWTDAAGSLLFLNQAGRRMMGAAEDEVIDSWAAAGLLSKEAITEARLNGTWHGETELLLRNGIRLPVAQTVIAHRSEEGAIRFYSIIARDISEGYELEQMKDEFVANITHELRSPLTGVIGYLELLTSGAFGELDPAVMEALQDVDTSSNQMLELINDLLDLWRAEGRAGAEMADVHLGSVVEAAVKTIGPVAAGKRITLSFDADELVTVGDRRQLERAFLNVVSNAVKFTPIGGRVDVTVRSVDRRAVVRVTDSGVGIPPSELESVFERFYRASTAEEAAIPGTGLGLPLVREVIRAHGGDAVIESEVGAGTTVIIDLPILVRTGAPVAVR